MKFLTVLFLCLSLVSTQAEAKQKTNHPAYDRAMEALVNDDKETAIKELLIPAEEGDIDSQFLLAITYSEEGDVDSGVQWFKKAAQNGDFRSQQILDIREQYK